jgi:hypothetical protein
MIRQNGEAVPPLRGGLFAKALTFSFLLSFFHRRYDYEDSRVPSATLGKASVVPGRLRREQLSYIRPSLDADA